MSTSRFERSASRCLDPRRIGIARMRRGLTKLELGQQIGVTARTITKYETEGAPISVASALASVLNFPVGYFSRVNPPAVTASGVNFRAARRVTARQRDAAAAAGVLGVEINGWVSRRFLLPLLDLPVFHGDSPREAAGLLRAMWGLGTKPLPNLVQLCESKGIRVYTLPPFADAVDAYSIWYDEVPYVFLARRKTPERIRFDLAHEVGHLLLHRAEPAETTAHEREADAFASEFLVPGDSVVEYLRYNPSVTELLEVKNQFKVSAMALAYAAHRVGRLSDWTYRQTCIELSQRGFRSAEPAGMPNYEMSRVFPQVLSAARGARVSARMIAQDLDVPVSEVHALTFGAELRAAHNVEAAQYTPPDRHRELPSTKPQLQIV
ncbi:putative Zn peptidase [Mycobacteroides abscessus subsp. massiliense]|nr:putative Zn peptidase [Mycobacteroides abscessus subsp. massiliense]SKZ39641.1 putative Zn peptidase [Mycobacteroides abscessus subsp. massiliense]